MPLLSLPTSEQLDLRPACVTGGRIKTWAGKYKALVDDDSASASACIGWAYEVQCPEHEEALRIYETERYQVVRCTIEMWEQSVGGLTFRFVDPSPWDLS